MGLHELFAPTPQERLKVTLAENKLCSIVGEQLYKHYPGWRWSVECTLSTGTINVRNMNLSGKYGFVLFISQVERPGGESLAVTAGGELLERCGFPRGAKPHDFNPERDIRGDVKALDTYGA